MNWKQRIRLAVASLIVFAWFFVEVRHGRIRAPTLELRLIVLCSVVYLFGETTVEQVFDRFIDSQETDDG